MTERPLKDFQILVVEDDQDLREILCEMLESFGAHVVSATNGNEALDCLARSPVQIILSDVRMPGGDGLDFLETLRRRGPFHPPFLFVSGYADLEEREAISRGAHGLFPKPFDPADLIAAIRRHALPEPLRTPPSERPAHEQTARS